MSNNGQNNSQVAGLLMQMANGDRQALVALRRALLAAVFSANVDEFRAGLIQIAKELEKRYNQADLQ